MIALPYLESLFINRLIAETPKDPGIPNNFPFKDQILAEVSETRRIVSDPRNIKELMSLMNFQGS